MFDLNSRGVFRVSSGASHVGLSLLSEGPVEVTPEAGWQARPAPRPRWGKLGFLDWYANFRAHGGVRTRPLPPLRISSVRVFQG